MAIIPEKGMRASYATNDCSLKLQVISYNEYKKIVKLKVLKSLNGNPKCQYKEGSELTLEGKALDDLILE